MKRFKAFFMSLVLLTCMLGSSVSVNAATYSTGKAVIPFFYQTSNNMYWYTVSNITDAPIDVTVTFYNSDGSMATDDSSSSTGRITGSSDLLNYSDQNTDSTLTFTLNPHSTGAINTDYSSTAYYGYGIIQWKQNGTTLQGLVAYGSGIFINTSGEISRDSITINSGLPF